MNRRERRRERKTGRAGAAASVKRAASLTVEASRKLDAGDSAAAERSLRQAIAADPTSAVAHHMLGLICYRTGRVEEAGQHVLEAALRDDRQFAYHANCAAIMNLLGRAPEAEAAARHAIELEPGRAEAHNALAVALDVQGRRDEAIAACDRAIEIAPTYVEAQINRGNLCFRGGRLDDAWAAFRRAVEIEPDNAMARANLAVVLRRRGEGEAAERECREAIARNPNFAEAHNTLGLILKDKGDGEAALAAFAEAARLAPAMVDAQLNRAGALFALGRMEESEAAYGAILAHQPARAEALGGLGVVLLAAGRLTEAARRFRAALAARPDYPEALYNLVAADGTLTDDEVESAKTLLERQGRSDEDAAKLHFALGETLDRKGDRKGAFSHVSEGNALRRRMLTAAGRAFDAEAHDRRIDEIISVFDRDLFATHAGTGSGDDRPVFVVGMPRSGTTLVEQILAAHPRVHGLGEADILARLANQIPCYPKDIASLGDEGAAAMARRGLDLMGANAGTSARIVDKTPQGFLHLGLAAILYPKARVIRCCRDPRDTGLSCYFQNFVAGHPWTTDLADIGRYARAEARLWTHWRATLPLAWTEIEYERLVVEPENESRRLIAFLGLEWDDSCLRFHEGRRPVLTASAAQVRKPIGKGSVGRWRAYADELGPLIAALGDLMPAGAPR